MDSSDKVNCIPKCGIGLKIEEEEAVDSDKIENKKKEEDGIEVNIKTEEIMLEDFKLESEPDSSAGCSNQLNWTDPTLGHVVFLPPIKSEMLSEESDPDQDEDFNLNCEVVLGDCEVPKDKEGETVVKNEPTSSDSYTASGSLQESKISHGQDGVNPSSCKQKKKKDSQPMAKVIDGCKTFRCQACPYKTARSHDIRKHMQIHTGKGGRAIDSRITVRVIDGRKTYRCQTCTYRTVRLDNMRKHTNTHLGLKPYKCSRCSYSSSDPTALKQHVAVHSELRPFKCNLCSYTSGIAAYVKRHMAMHSQDKPFCCAHCEFRSARKNNLVIHLKAHSADNAFRCGECAYKSVHRHHLKRHMLTRHGRREGAVDSGLCINMI